MNLLSSRACAYDERRFKKISYGQYIVLSKLCFIQKSHNFERIFYLNIFSVCLCRCSV